MKNTFLSLITIISLSSFAFAEQNSVIMQAIEEENSYEDVDAGVYIGLAYSHHSHDADTRDKTTMSEMDFYAVTLQVGYKFNPYIAVEGRYAKTFGEPWQVKGAMPSDDSEISTMGIYLKPMYPIGPEFDMYVLLGYTSTEVIGEFSVDDSFAFDEGSFSWGVGGTYALTEELALFIDYTEFYDDNPVGRDSVVDSFNFGLSYHF
ncbi:MAG: porin family protein [Campylobacterota bacterium]|nr:porin family protein [Campylobacterota bacterium]